jgi:pimeloyl-ACP methyl ester carboxylesterase
VTTAQQGTAHVNGVDLYYEVSGNGVPVVLISGLGGNAELWIRQAPALSESHSVVLFDNRGAGRSDAPEGPYTVKMMASDTAQLLDALDIAAAHIVGASMGGMIAQEVALQYPDKALSLTLIGAQCGGSHAFGAAEENATALQELATLDMTPQERARGWLPYTLSQEFREANPDLVEEFVRITGQYPCTTVGLRAQWAALMGYDSWERLPDVATPTLILQGSHDKLVPPENADVLGVRIPDSRVVLIEGAGHSVAFEFADHVNKLLLGFFAENADGGGNSAE